jgi:hypothetical protein
MECARCGESRDSTDLDRMLWCEACVSGARTRAGRIGWISGGLVAGALALWIWLGVAPSMDLIPRGWLAVVVAAAWLGSKMAREVAFGVLRARE